MIHVGDDRKTPLHKKIGVASGSLLEPLTPNFKRGERGPSLSPEWDNGTVQQGGEI